MRVKIDNKTVLWVVLAVNIFDISLVQELRFYLARLEIQRQLAA